MRDERERAEQRLAEQLAKELGYLAFGAIKIPIEAMPIWNALLSREMENERLKEEIERIKNGPSI